jgi:hypothetical protein
MDGYGAVARCARRNTRWVCLMRLRHVARVRMRAAILPALSLSLALYFFYFCLTWRHKYERDAASLLQATQIFNMMLTLFQFHRMECFPQVSYASNRKSRTFCCCHHTKNRVVQQAMATQTPRTQYKNRNATETRGQLDVARAFACPCKGASFPSRRAERER